VAFGSYYWASMKAFNGGCLGVTGVVFLLHWGHRVFLSTLKIR